MSSKIYDKTDFAVFRDLFTMICSQDPLGEGSARTVYDCDILPDCVVKVEDRAESFQNIMEWETWQRVKDTEFAKHFAPCSFISPNGIILIMAKTRSAERSDYPEKMPAFFTDFKYDNFGMINGQLVCHDYGVHVMMENGMTKRLKKADWWE